MFHRLHTLGAAIMALSAVLSHVHRSTSVDGGPEQQAYDDLPKHRLYVGIVHLSLVVRSLAGMQATLPAITS